LAKDGFWGAHVFSFMHLVEAFKRKGCAMHRLKYI